MKVIILAGGKATRLPESAKKIPKALIVVHGKTVLERQLEHLRFHGLTDVCLSLGWMADKIISFVKERHPHIRYAVENEPLGTGGALKFALNNHKEPFIAMNGDVLTDCNVLEFIKQAKTPSMVAAQVENTKDYGLLEIKNRLIAGFHEKPNHETPGFINAGIYYLDPKIIRDFPKKSFSIEKDVFPELVRTGFFHAFIHRGFWIDMGTEERLRALQNSEFLKS